MLVVGYMCQRPALLVRSKVAYEENIREKRRLAGESKRIFNAVNAAKEESITFLESEDGMLMVREEAEKRIIEMEAYVEEEGYKNSCGRNKLQPAIFSAVFAGAKSSVSKIKSQVQGERKQKIVQVEKVIKREYIDHQVAKNTRKVLEDNRKIVWILKSWMGLSVDDAFRGWRQCVKKSKQRRRREDKLKLKQLRLDYEESVAKYEQKMLEHRNWTEIWDEFNDVPVWVNSLTGVSQYQLPRLQDPPLLPNVLLDQDTGEMMSPPSSIENEVDSNSDEESQYSETGERLFSEKPAPRGKEEEFELAAGRVLEIRRQQLRSRYF
ncbi:hypothetical protein ACHAXS_010818 [Conticribra weissflogii]